MKICWFPAYDRTEKRPAKSLYIISSLASMRAVKQKNIVNCCAYLMWWVHIIDRQFCISNFLLIWSCLFDWGPFLRTMWHLSLSVDGGRWFLINLYVRPGNVINWWSAIAANSMDFRGKHIIWWWYIANSARVLVLMMLYLLSFDALIAV